MEEYEQSPVWQGELLDGVSTRKTSGPRLAQRRGGGGGVTGGGLVAAVPRPRWTPLGGGSGWEGKSLGSGAVAGRVPVRGQPLGG